MFKLIYMCELTSFVKHLQPRFVKYLKNYPLVCIKGSKFRDMLFWQYLWQGDIDGTVKHVSLVM